MMKVMVKNLQEATATRSQRHSTSDVGLGLTWIDGPSNLLPFHVLVELISAFSYVFLRETARD